jgi:Catalytic LigB subunit of aromatic ring-opening dioxygenase
MSIVVAGMASSHAYTFYEPAQWDARREVSYERYRKRYGRLPKVPAELAAASLEDDEQRYGKLREGFARLAESLAASKPDVLLLIGDDQHEHFVSSVPQFAIYTGEWFISEDTERGGVGEYRSDRGLARRLLTDVIGRGFDVVETTAFEGDRLISHAHAQILSFLRPTVPVIPVFLNAVHTPAPSPARCLEFGRALRASLDADGSDKRIIAYGSGGLSHFSAGYPYHEYDGDLDFGFFSMEFDDQVLGWMRAGQNGNFASLTSKELLDNGEVELRQWITLLGLLGDIQPQWLLNEPFYRGVMDMAVGYWQVP